MAQRIDTTIEGELKAGDGVQVGDTKYEYGADLHTDGAPVIDPGQGKQVSIRTFDFQMNPDVNELPDRQELFNIHSRQIATILWSDGLKPLDSVGPRVIIDSNKRTYKIFVPCEARTGSSFADKAQNLSELLKQNGNKGN